MLKGLFLEEWYMKNLFGIAGIEVVIFVDVDTMHVMLELWRKYPFYWVIISLEFALPMFWA